MSYEAARPDGGNWGNENVKGTNEYCAAANKGTNDGSTKVNP